MSDTKPAGQHVGSDVVKKPNILKQNLDRAIMIIGMIWILCIVSMCGAFPILQIKQNDAILCFGYGLTVVCAILWIEDSLRLIHLEKTVRISLWTVLIATIISTTALAYKSITIASFKQQSRIKINRFDTVDILSKNGDLLGKNAYNYMKAKKEQYHIRSRAPIYADGFEPITFLIVYSGYEIDMNKKVNIMMRIILRCGDKVYWFGERSFIGDPYDWNNSDIIEKAMREFSPKIYDWHANSPYLAPFTPKIKFNERTDCELEVILIDMLTGYSAIEHKNIIFDHSVSQSTDIK